MSTYTSTTWQNPSEAETKIPQLQRLLWDVFSVTETRVREAPDHVVDFRGRITQAPSYVHSTINGRFNDLGYTAFLFRDNNADVIQAIEGVVKPTPAKVWINLLLLVLTIITTLMAGAVIAGVRVGTLEIFARQPELLLRGIPFGASLLLILGIHEMGHYFAGRLHKAAVTLPYFIPVPPFGALPLGTLGAFIQLRSPIQNRRALFDIGLAGPIAGLVVAMAVFVYGLTVEPTNTSRILLGRSIFTQFVTGLIHPGAVRSGFDVGTNPFLLAGWFGLFVTVINLLPIGQLDGGHILYAVLGRYARLFGIATIVGLLALGYFTQSPTWTLWGFLGLAFGINHAPPLDDITPLDPPRKLIAIITFIIFVLIFVPTPFR
jgi:membrane-associated protease RseP (regulator of RpoE activity)